MEKKEQPIVNTDERSKIHWAATRGDVREVQELLDQGENPDKADDEGWTPMISAAASEFVQVVAKLLEAGANPGLKTKQGRDAFFYAVSRCNMPLTDLFIINDYTNFKPDKYGSNCVHRAIVNPKCTPEFLQMLLNNDAPFKAVDGEGNNAMHLACYENRPELIKWLKEVAGLSMEFPLNEDKKAPKDLLPPPK